MLLPFLHWYILQECQTLEVAEQSRQGQLETAQVFFLWLVVILTFKKNKNLAL